MKKFLAFLLAAVLMFTVCPAVLADDQLPYAAECEETTAGVLSEGAALQVSASPDPVELLQAYAPLIWYSRLETYWPSSIEEMYECATVVDGTVNYNKPWYKLKGTLGRAKNYAFYCEKNDGSIALVYWQYYMTDPGKFMILSHYGDWEHCSVRLENIDGVWTPTQFSYNHHGINTKISWDDASLIKDGTHPIVYAAKGSHGLYTSAGLHRHLYVLTDITGEGTKWETWNSLECYYKTADNVSSLSGTDHVTDFQTIKIWGQSSNSVCGPLDKVSVSDPNTFD